MTFSRHYLCCFTIVPLFVLDRPMAWNRCLLHTCFKNLCKIAQASKNSDSNDQHFLLDSLTHSWFHSMLFALPGYQFPYIVMNRCLYLRSQRGLLVWQMCWQWDRSHMWCLMTCQATLLFVLFWGGYFKRICCWDLRVVWPLKESKLSFYCMYHVSMWYPCPFSQSTLDWIHTHGFSYLKYL
jgi:hypothetical protein